MPHQKRNGLRNIRARPQPPVLVSCQVGASSPWDSLGDAGREVR